MVGRDYSFFSTLIFMFIYVAQKNSNFYFGNGYFYNYYGQTLFSDGILIDIMMDNGEIWCKLSALVMVYIH